MTTAVKIMATLTAHPDKAAEKELPFELAARSREEPGNLRWDIWRDQVEPTRFVLDAVRVA